MKLISFTRRSLGVGGLLLLTHLASAQNQPPTIQNLSATVNWPTNTLTIQYDALDAEGDPLDISLEVSNNGGKTYLLTSTVPASGHIGFPVAPGTDRIITCDVSILALTTGTFTVRVVADDRQPFDLQALVNEVDSNRLRENLRFVEGIRHRTAGKAHLTAVADSLRQLFASSGLFADEQTFSYTGGYTGRNILGTFPGTSAAAKVVVADAHYDSVSNAPGADDNGSGTVGVMELARLLSRYPTKKSLRFIGFDLEEAGLIGSTRYVSTGIPTGESIEGVFNFEMIGFYSNQPNSQQLPAGFEILFPAAYNQVANDGFRGNFITNVGNTTSKPLIALYANSAAQYVPGLKVVSVEVPGNGQIAPDLRRSDHTPFWEAGKQALMLTDGANFRNTCYHTPCDTAEDKLDFRFMSQVVKATLASMAQLAEIQHGDWATVTFKNTSRNQERITRPCALSLSSSPKERDVLNLFTQDCPLQQVGFELYDERGALLFQQDINPLPTEGQMQIFLPTGLVPGMYFAKFSWTDGSWTDRVIIR